MMNPWGPLAPAAVLCLTLGAGVAAAQTVVVRQAPPGSTVELVVNADAVASAQADTNGDASLPLDLSGKLGRPEMDAQVYVDLCGDVHRVQLVERGGQPPPPGESCSRREIRGVFHVRRVTTLVVYLDPLTPTLRLVQGSFSLAEPGPARAWGPSPAGLVVFGGGGFRSVRDARTLACGSVEPCDDQGSPFAYAAGAAYWVNRFIAAEVSFLRPAEVRVEGSGQTYRFDSSLDAHLLTVAGKVGIPMGPVRLYGRAGMNYHRALSSTTQTSDDVEVTIDGVTSTIPGGTQTFELETAGWGWLYGGGLEAWLRPSFALYLDGGLARLKGAGRDGAEGSLDDRLSYIMLGARLRIGR